MRRFHLDRFLHGDEICHTARTIMRGPAMNPHTHDFLETFWIESGRGIHRINGKEHALQAGDLVFIRKDDRHDLVGDIDDALCLLNVAFRVRVATDLIRRYPMMRGRFWDVSDLMPSTVRLDAVQTRRLREYFHNLFADRASLFALDLFLMRVVAAASGASDQDAGECLPAWLRDACAKIRQVEHFVIGVPAFVKLAGRTHEHVARVTRELLDRSPSDLVNEARLGFAAEELVATDRTVVDIALGCGYESVAYFHSRFKGQFGETPRRYRIRHQALT